MTEVDPEVAEANNVVTEGDTNHEAHTDDTSANPQGPAVDTADDTSTEAGVTDEEKSGEDTHNDSEDVSDEKEYGDVNVHSTDADLHAYVNSKEIYAKPTNSVVAMRTIEHVADTARRLWHEAEQKVAQLEKDVEKEAEKVDQEVEESFK